MYDFMWLLVTYRNHRQYWRSQEEVHSIWKNWSGVSEDPSFVCRLEEWLSRSWPWLGNRFNFRVVLKLWSISPNASRSFCWSRWTWYRVVMQTISLEFTGAVSARNILQCCEVTWWETRSCDVVHSCIWCFGLLHRNKVLCHTSTGWQLL